MTAGRWVFVGSAALIGVFADGASVGARQGDHMRAAVLLTCDADRALLDRLRGQTSDLAVDLVGVEVTSLELEADLPAQVRAADVIAARLGARAVIWVELVPTTGRPAVVYVAEPLGGRVLARVLAPVPDSPAGVESSAAASTLPGSATLEAAALVLRGALRALATGGTIGVHREDVVDPRARPAEARRPDAMPAVAAPASDRVVDAAKRVSRVGVLAAGGWQVAADGHSPSGQQGVLLRLGVSTGTFDLALAGAAGLDATIRLPGDEATANVARDSLCVLVGAHRNLGSGLRLGVAVLGGFARFTRQTAATAEEIAPTPTRRHVSLAVGPEASASFAPRFLRGSLGLVVSVGADFLPAAPVLGYDVEGGAFVPASRLWRVQPRLGLALAWIGGGP